MYSAFFGFREDPFGVSPDARFFFPSNQHAEAIASLKYAILERRGFATLIGSPGLGKTSILAALSEQLADVARVAFIVDPAFGFRNMLESVLFAIGLDPEPDPVRRMRQLQELLFDLNRAGRTCVIIIDEAQHLDPTSLESIRMLSNFETPTRKLIQFILAGQPGLADLLNHRECEQIRQRVNVAAKLRRLTCAETEEYIAHRLTAAGTSSNPFTSGALRAIAAAAGGVPRIINTMCFNALSLAFAYERHAVTEAHVGEIIDDLKICNGYDTVQKPLESVRVAGPVIPQHASFPPRSFLFRAAATLIAAASSRKSL
jgi:general secretion pathway protein A